MMDFTAALYLGMTHSSASLRPFRQLTTGRPNALGTPVLNFRIAAFLADLTGCEQAVLGPSTLHLFWDLFNMLAEERIAIFSEKPASSNNQDWSESGPEAIETPRMRADSPPISVSVSFKSPWSTPSKKTIPSPFA
jgi:8-amino-7-oxononanoate synthase